MTNKIAVTLKPYTRVLYPYQKLKICAKCSHFTVLGEDLCAICGKSSLKPLEKRAAVLVQKKIWRERLFLLILAGAGIPFCESPLQIGLLAGTAIAVLAFIWTLQVRSTPALCSVQLEKLLQRNAYALVTGLAQDRQAAIKVFQGGDKPRTYEMLREIGALVQTDQLRLEQILLLQTFHLRRDMDLMIEPLLMDVFHPDLAAYIGELAKIRRDLLKENTFRYVLQHEAEILKMANGKAILTGVSAAAVRKKRYIALYPYLLIRYARYLPKDRFLRLFRFVQNHSFPHSETLHHEVMRIYDEKYKWDHEFSPS
ncbi:hypothetical protein ACFQZE_00815 [Paenibacillus sp. GCM10027627]|uniref:hypothetical protein n=1 Tax=unclassified Paenibacillus TaxID=185978 RepID=UPI00363C0A0B